ncbi:galactosyl transferase GMA12/MNN10 family-domain-containing protein [Lasiosphaeria hispida]|uniref:Galactosyl transferase GMA12/MNN10 family-domain-containing protein n=1 Tax=Lasiosphaeria hispida TaxID=260671 RepID=A0AAJ0H9A0_9PEZI|nr:galactosyl transferase GMA12/MNN10 family-domain-containing protein [Lasiosphaeria hispida]
MHFAYPPRKSSNPPPYLRASKLPGLSLRRSRMKVIALAGLAFVTLLYILTRPSIRHGTYTPHKPSGNPPAVIVTLMEDGKYSKSYLDMIKENRIQYAQKHGYQTFFPQVGEYELKGAPTSWTKVVAVRHALTKYPDAKFFWFLEQNSFIMNPLLKIEDHVMKSSRLEELMIKDHPVVPPDSIIKTFSHLRGQDVDFVLTQDKEGLSAGSFVIRNGDWAKFFLETWFDPLYRSYNFQKAEAHALEHIVQWHPTILARLALVDQRIINSYSKDAKGQAWQPGDIVVRFSDCSASSIGACEAESQRFNSQWRTSFKNV